MADTPVVPDTLVCPSTLSPSDNLTVIGGGGASSPTITNPKLSGTTFTLDVPTEVGFNYMLDYKNSLNDVNWTPVRTNSGSGGIMTLTNTGVLPPSRVYRVRVE